MKTFLSVLTVLAAIVAFWYAACVPMNIKGVLDTAERGGAEVMPATSKARRDMGTFGLVAGNTFAIAQTWEQDRPRLPAPRPPFVSPETPRARPAWWSSRGLSPTSGWR